MENKSVLEFFAVGEIQTALFYCAVKGGVNHQKGFLSAIINVLLKHFLKD